MTAFPLEQATRAVEALSGTWLQLAGRHRDGFHRSKKEPDLTLVLCSRVRDLHPRMLGHWSAEPVHVQVDPTNLTIQARTRTDIEYTWNDARNWKIVFEFKKLKKAAGSHKAYLGDDGLGRFVDGCYSHGDALACMVGIVIDDYSLCVVPLEKALGSDASVQARLRMHSTAGGAHLQRPSILFPSVAAFDTVHSRPPAKGSRHNKLTIL